MTDLKPCDCCYGELEYVCGDFCGMVGASVRCISCGATGWADDGKFGAAVNWNEGKRSPPRAPEEDPAYIAEFGWHDAAGEWHSPPRIDKGASHD
jgi:hypothetical protein